jgi:UDP-glucose 4-epimerase/UDP-glucuronate decarboxylase
MGADHVIPELSLRAIRREDPFRLYGAEQRRAFCHVSDAVEAMVRLMGTEAAGGQVVNIGNDAEETRIGDLARLVLEVANFAPALQHVPAPPGSVERRCPDLAAPRARRFQPKITLAAGARETFLWYRDRAAGAGR